MKLFNLFRTKGAKDSTENQGVQVAEDGADQALKNLIDSHDIITIEYGTRMPIDLIYNYIAKDYENDGYQDSLMNSGVEYCRTKEKIILNNLRLLFKRIQLRYRTEIMEIDVRVESAKALFALTAANHLEAHKQLCLDHINEIQIMMDKLEAQDPEMMTMIESYRRGFARGCTALTSNFLRPNISVAENQPKN